MKHSFLFLQPLNYIYFSSKMGTLIFIFLLFGPAAAADTKSRWSELGRDQCTWGLTDLTMESTARALLHYCLSTSPASESLMSEIENIKTPDAVVAKYCQSTGSLTRFQSSIFDLLD